MWISNTGDSRTLSQQAIAMHAVSIRTGDLLYWEKVEGWISCPQLAPISIQDLPLEPI